MNTAKIVSDESIEKALTLWRWDCDIDEGRLMLLELICKAASGSYNSHTEEGFLRQFGLLKRDRTPNKKGRDFICSMVYNHSNKKPFCFKLMRMYRD